MGLSILLGVVTNLVSSIFSGLTGIGAVHSSIFDLFSSGSLTGKALPEIFGLITNAVSSVCNNKEKVEELKVQLLCLCEQGKFKEYEDDYFDRENARLDYQELVKANKSPWEVPALTVILVSGYLVYLFLLSLLYIVYGHSDLRDLFLSSVTTLSTFASMAVSFWLGSNRASQDHQQLVSALQNSTPSGRTIMQKLRHPFQTVKDAVDEKINTTVSDAKQDL